MNLISISSYYSIEECCHSDKKDQVIQDRQNRLIFALNDNEKRQNKNNLKRPYL
jgi:hypothetical protein